MAFCIATKVVSLKPLFGTLLSRPLRKKEPR
jgi:hypothetical protein